MTTHATPSASQLATRARGRAAGSGDPVLASKITPPDVPEWAVWRPRITRLISEGVRWCPLTVVTGPAGAGKTTALALWVATGPGQVAWVGLDRFDNRPGVFWSYVIAALRRADVAAPDMPPAALHGPAGDNVFLPRLAAALAAQDPPVTLVLDDLHLLTDPGVLEELDYVLRNAGSGLRLVVASRTDPRLPLHRYQLTGQLAQIRAGDLAFSTAEAGLLLTRHGLTLTADSLQHLMRRTEGWAPVLAADSQAPDRVRVQARLVNARLNHDSGNDGRSRRSLAAALRLAEAEQLRLPFAAEGSWIGPALRRNPELAATYRCLLAPALRPEQLPTPMNIPQQAAITAVEPLSEREREVLRHVSGLMSNVEVASEMYISVDTVKTHLKNIYRKLSAAHRREAVHRARQLELI